MFSSSPVDMGSNVAWANPPDPLPGLQQAERKLRLHDALGQS